MFEWVMLVLGCLIVIVVGIYRHYKGDSECPNCCGPLYDDDEPEVIRPEIVEFCSIKYWKYDGSYMFHIPIGHKQYDNVVFRLRIINGEWGCNSAIRDFATEDEVRYIERVVGIDNRKVLAFEKMKEGINAKTD